MAEVKKLVECLKNKCQVEKAAVSLLNEMRVVDERLKARGKPSAEDVAAIRALADRIASHTVNAEDTRCMAMKCMDEYKAKTEKNMKMTAARMREAAKSLEMILGNAPRPPKKPESKKAKSKKRSPKKPESKP